MKAINSELQAFDAPNEAAEAIRALSRYGFDVKNLSLVRKAGAANDLTAGPYAVGECPLGWDTRDLWGTVWGLVAAPVVFFLPGLGMVALAGPVVAALMGAHDRSVLAGGVSLLNAALLQLGVRRDQLARYDAALQAGQFVLMMHGTPSEVVHAQQLLAGPNPGKRPSLPRPSPSERLS